MSSMKILYLCLIVICSLVYGSEVPRVVSQIHIMSPSSGFCIWICDVAGGHRKWHVARQVPGERAAGQAEPSGRPAARVENTAFGSPVCQLQRGALTYRPLSSEILHVYHFEALKTATLHLVCCTEPFLLLPKDGRSPSLISSVGPSRDITTAKSHKPETPRYFFLRALGVILK